MGLGFFFVVVFLCFWVSFLFVCFLAWLAFLQNGRASYICVTCVCTYQESTDILNNVITWAEEMAQ